MRSVLRPKRSSFREWAGHAPAHSNPSPPCGAERPQNIPVIVPLPPTSVLTVYVWQPYLMHRSYVVTMKFCVAVPVQPSEVESVTVRENVRTEPSGLKLVETSTGGVILIPS